MCQLRKPRLWREMGNAVRYTGHCTSEGDEWVTEFMLMQLDDGGLVVSRPGIVTQYRRCP